ENVIGDEVLMGLKEFDIDMDLNEAESWESIVVEEIMSTEREGVQKEVVEEELNNETENLYVSV
ncbi:hypothetical protein Tco_0609899, partial [Tanacetum coccineum]